MADDPRPFVIEVRGTWKLWILPILAALYFLAVVLLVVLDYRIEGVSNDMLALGGLVLFGLVVLIELPFLLRRRGPRAAAPPAERQPVTAAPTLAATPAAPGRADDELLITGESQQGLQVLEYSAPAKSRNQNAVYTKTYVPVTAAHVLRIETAVADASDI